MATDLIRIAIAEDQRLFRECLAANLEAMQDLTIVLEASNGRELLQAIETQTVEADVVVLDLNMPEMNGLECTQALRLLQPALKILILSVHNEERHITRLVEQGANGYLAKNAEFDEVVRAVREVHTRGFYFNETTMRALQNGMRTPRARTFDLASPLTKREQEILVHICRELTAAEIAEKLFISVRTVEGHRNQLLEKTGARNTAGLVMYALKHRLFDLDLD